VQLIHVVGQQMSPFEALPTPDRVVDVHAHCCLPVCARADGP
jgi:hypothetical protein